MQRQAGSNTEVANSLAIIHTLDQAGSDRRAQGEVLGRLIQEILTEFLRQS